MKLLLPFIFALLFSISTAQIFNALPGADDNEKIELIRGAVARLRHFVAGQACFTQYFPNPGDNDAIERWAAWICSYVGGNTSHPNCSWYSQFGDNTTQVTDNSTLLQELNLKHDGANADISIESAVLFTQLLAAALRSVGTTSLTDSDIIEAFAFVQDGIVTAGHENDGCPTPDTTIQWSAPVGSVHHDDSVILGGLVSWVWADTTEHSVTVDTGETAVLTGWGSQGQSLTRTTGCISAASYPDGGEPCNLAASGEFTYSQYFPAHDTIDYHCTVHAGLTGTLVVGNGGGNTNTNTNTSPGSFSSSADGDGGAASKLTSWLRF